MLRQTVDDPTARLQEIVEEFQDLDARERLELLLDFAEGMPELPPEYQARRDAGENRVHECQTPTWLWVEPVGDRVHILGDVAPEAPTVKGFMGVLIAVFDGSRPADLLAVRGSPVQQLGLIESLGIRRLHGLTAVWNRIRRGATQALEQSSASGPERPD